MGVQQYLISARFFTTMGHFVAILMLFSTIEHNIMISLPDGYSADEKQTALEASWAALIFGFICFLLDFSGIFFGTSLFNNKGNMFHILLHFIGSILLCWLITDTWHYKALWPIVICCNLPTALFEVGVLVSIYVLGIVVY